jgi:hypothetical protein
MKAKGAQKNPKKGARGVNFCVMVGGENILGLGGGFVIR